MRRARWYLLVCAGVSMIAGTYHFGVQARGRIEGQRYYRTADDRLALATCELRWGHFLQRSRSLPELWARLRTFTFDGRIELLGPERVACTFTADRLTWRSPADYDTRTLEASARCVTPPDYTVTVTMSETRSFQDMDNVGADNGETSRPPRMSVPGPGEKDMRISIGRGGAGGGSTLVGTLTMRY
jgi:hypothetical protein